MAAPEPAWTAAWAAWGCNPQTPNQANWGGTPDGAPPQLWYNSYVFNWKDLI